MTVTVIGNNTGDDYAGQDDGQIRNKTNVDNNFDADSREIAVDHWASDQQVDGLLVFTGLSNIDSAEIVSAVSLGMHQKNGGGTFGLTFDRLLRNWVAAQVTWNDYATSTAWTTGGGYSVGNDIAGNSWTEPAFDATIQYTVMSDAQLILDVQDWIDGTESNYGMHIWQTETTSYGIYKEFEGESGTDGNQPYLSVTHEAAGEDASGSPTIGVLTSAGTAELEHSATGAPSALLPESAGVADAYPSPTITSVSGDNAWDDGDTSIPIVGTGFV